MNVKKVNTERAADLLVQLTAQNAVAEIAIGLTVGPKGGKFALCCVEGWTPAELRDLFRALADAADDGLMRQTVTPG